MSRSPRARDYSQSRSPSPRQQDENRPRSMSIERAPRRQARSPTRPAHSKDTRVSLYVSGLGPKVTEDDLYEHFAKEGKVLANFHDCVTQRGTSSTSLKTPVAFRCATTLAEVTALFRFSGFDGCMRPACVALLQRQRLLSHFEWAMQVTESRIVSDPRTYESRGFGFVGYATD